MNQTVNRLVQLRSIVLTGLCVIALAPQLLANQSAMQAVGVLPESLQNGVVKISADNGNPDPPTWYFICRSSNSDDGIVSVTVQGGAITNQKPSLDMRVLMGGYSSIDFGKVQVDSRGAWNIAERFATSEGKKLGTVSYALQQKGKEATPIWSVWCYAPSGSYIGLLKVLASTGDVIFSD